MRFEFDHRTGTMQPRKDDNIYFAQSQGGGLIVDDKKNNLRYIIERNEKITKLFGNFRGDALNLYDMRDARMISDRVVRLLGKNHKYADFHYFLKGYHMSESVVKNSSFFFNESLWGEIRKKSLGQEVRSEEGKVIGSLEDGTKLILPTDAFSYGEIVEFDDNQFYTLTEPYDEYVYIAVINKGDTDTYYKYDENSEAIVNMVECFQADASLRTNNDFGMLRALMCQDEWDNGFLDGLDVTAEERCVTFRFGSSFEFAIYDDWDKAKDEAVEQAIDIERDTLKSLTNTSNTYLTSSERENKRKQFKDFIENIRRFCGNDGFDEDELKDVFVESYESDYDEFDEDDAIDALLSNGIIEDTEDYFELDEDGEIDHSLPKFDYTDYKDKYVEKMVDDMDDYIDEYIFRFGYDGIEEYIDFDTVGERYVDNDGPAHWLANEDSEERTEEIDNVTYYIYRKS